jgi:hypothetical protein
MIQSSYLEPNNHYGKMEEPSQAKYDHRSSNKHALPLSNWGHAEKRRIFGENDEHVAKEAAAAAHNGLIPHMHRREDP